jgi:hypothetical protein
LGMIRFPAYGSCLLLALLVAGAAAFAQPPGPDTPPASPVPPAAQEMPAEQETMYQGEATSILGRQVRGPDDKTVGRIVDVLVDNTGQPRAVVVDVGGFLGIGNRRIAVAWRALHFSADVGGEGSISLDMTVNQIKAMPEYKAASRPVVVAVPPRTDQTSP